ncbi:hypothetical protein EVAR_86424_1 [Eumeta japonica]|uniref:Uncharacterized protein n=1 Tax=Eumeta variegata TaxID=151549 RepID=A0A4C1Z964_EUMVA|nr:hypothetical protein EVAR_86424_1 [Eumeta japonica]
MLRDPLAKLQNTFFVTKETRKTMPRNYDAGARLGLCTLSTEDWTFFENVQYVLDLIRAHAQYGESFSLNLFRRVGRDYRSLYNSFASLTLSSSSGSGV